jgi:pimeloyl-ACP methyl ester carboxylesterase
MSDASSQAHAHDERSHADAPVAADVRLRGVRVRYIDAGAPDAPAVVLLHGLGLDRNQWSGLIEPLSRTRRVIAFDFPGFGDSDRPSPSVYRYGFEALAETTLDLLAALEVGRCALIGHSIGAGAALVAAADRPEFVERLVLVAPPCFRTSSPTALRLAMLPVVGRPLFQRLLGGAVLRRHLGAYAGEREDGRSAIDDAALREATYAMLKAAIDPDTLRARLPRVRAPTLVVWGRDDHVVPWTFGTRLAREIAGARLEILECGHAPEAERPDAFETLVQGFLTDPSASLPADAKIAVDPRLPETRARGAGPTRTTRGGRSS